MSLSDRLSSVQPNRSNRGCETCLWLSTLSASDRASFDEWVDNGWSITQLWEIASSETDNPLRVSLSGMRHHTRHHKSAG